ncbi:MAG: hypothetical protein RL256_829 [Actinomycetota bacterium]
MQQIVEDSCHLVQLSTISIFTYPSPMPAKKSQPRWLNPREMKAGLALLHHRFSTIARGAGDGS